MPIGDVVIVTGPPGAGKTSTARLLAERTKPMSVHLESDWFFRFIVSGFVGPHLPESNSQNAVVLDLTADAAVAYALAGYTVFWDGIVGPWFLDRVAGRLSAAGVRTHYLVLRPERPIALDRVRKRDGTTETSGAETMYDQLSDLGELEGHVVESSGEPANVTDRCVEALASGLHEVRIDVWTDPRWRVSVKGVLGWDDRFVVLKNERDEWELPGGRLEADDIDAPAALRREIREELDIEVEVDELLDTWIYDVAGTRVLIVTYRCTAPQPSAFTHSDEHTGVALLSRDELASAAFPDGYLRSIWGSR